MTFFVDIPNFNGESRRFDARVEAISFAKERFGADDEGRICLVTGSDEGRLVSDGRIVRPGPPAGGPESREGPLVVDPADVYSGNMVQGEIRVRAAVHEMPEYHEMPEPGSRVSFAGHIWIVTRTGVITEGGRPCYIALLVPPS